MKGYRTVLFGLVVALLPAGMGIGSAIISLRSITTTRIAAK